MSQINQDIFRRYSARVKKDIVSKLSRDELLSVSEDTLIRIVKEVGYSLDSTKARSHNKRLHFRCSSGWNFLFEEVWYCKKKLTFYGCVFYENTDSGSIDLTYNELVSRRDTDKHWTYRDEYGNSQTVYCRVDMSDKANVIQAILNTYVDLKEKKKQEV